MTINEELALMLIMRSDMEAMIIFYTREDLIKFLIDDSGFGEEMHGEDRLELELALDTALTALS